MYSSSNKRWFASIMCFHLFVKFTCGELVDFHGRCLRGGSWKYDFRVYDTECRLSSELVRRRIDAAVHFSKMQHRVLLEHHHHHCHCHDDDHYHHRHRHHHHLNHHHQHGSTGGFYIIPGVKTLLTPPRSSRQLIENLPHSVIVIIIFF